ncbi:MAG: NTP transferase domain-containing protein [Acidimicrobiales bacterium]|nr:NTP transferase domain-containing protein [Acidimicrobiales bacterium]
MGTDKALLEVDGVALARRAARALAAGGAGEVVLVGASAAVGDRMAMDVVPDDRPGEGPLAGLATALRWASGRGGAEVLLVAACDQPDLEPALLAELVRRVDAATVAGAVPRTPDGRRHPFPAAWRVDAAGALAQLVAGGARRMADAMALDVEAVDAAAPTLLDLDDPDDLARRLDRSWSRPP